MMHAPKSDVKLLLLQMAQEILHNQYVEHKTRIYNEWALSAASLWKTQGIKLAYPDMPAYPDQIKVVHTAQVLWNFVFNPCDPEPEVPPDVDSHVRDPEPELQMPHIATTPDVHEIVEQHDVLDHIMLTPPELLPINLPDLNTVISDLTVKSPGTHMSEDVEKTRLSLIPSWLLKSNRT
jgi:hypothetical protein